MSWWPRPGHRSAVIRLTAACCAAGALAAIAVSCHTPPPPAAGTNESGGRPAGARGWPHEPAGLNTLTDRAWTELAGAQWNRRDSSADRIVQDASVPDAPTSALEYVYPTGFAGGRAPATHFYPLDHLRELFVGLEWKVSEPWQGHSSGVNKIQFMYTGSSDVAMVMYGQNGGPYDVRVLPQWPEHTGRWLTPNATNASIIPGRWHRLEWYLKYESQRGAADGIIRWWIDGALAGDYTQVPFPADGGFVEYQISPTWGGVGDTKTETDAYRFHRSYISGR
jgi:hypothetical protein